MSTTNKVAQNLGIKGCDLFRINILLWVHVMTVCGLSGDQLVTNTPDDIEK